MTAFANVPSSECGSVDFDEGNTQARVKRTLPRLLMLMATLGFALTALFAWHHSQRSKISVASTGSSMPVVQKDELDDLRSQLLGDDDSGGSDDDVGDEKDKKDKKDEKDKEDSSKKDDGLFGRKFDRTPLGKFKQCGGGPDWTGSICCKTGCACVIRSMFYSMCQTPKGAQDCDEDGAKDEVRRAIIRAKIAPKKIPNLERLTKEAKKLLPALKKEAEKAKQPLKKILPTATKMHKAKDDAVKKATEARKKADKISKDAAARGKELWQVQNDNKKLLASGPPFSKTYYKIKGKVDALKKQTDDLTGQMKATEAEAKKLEAAAKKITHKANGTGALHSNAQRKADLPIREYNSTKKRADSLAAQLQRAKDAVKYEAANVNLWRKAAKGDTCNELIASDVHEDPIVDYGGGEVSDEEAERAVKQQEHAQEVYASHKKEKAFTHKHAKHLQTV